MVCWLFSKRAVVQSLILTLSSSFVVFFIFFASRQMVFNSLSFLLDKPIMLFNTRQSFILHDIKLTYIQQTRYSVWSNVCSFYVIIRCNKLLFVFAFSIWTKNYIAYWNSPIIFFGWIAEKWIPFRSINFKSMLMDEKVISIASFFSLSIFVTQTNTLFLSLFHKTH